MLTSKMYISNHIDGLIYGICCAQDTESHSSVTSSLTERSSMGASGVTEKGHRTLEEAKEEAKHAAVSQLDLRASDLQILEVACS